MPHSLVVFTQPVAPVSIFSFKELSTFKITKSLFKPKNSFFCFLTPQLCLLQESASGIGVCPKKRLRSKGIGWRLSQGPKQRFGSLAILQNAT
jgi:hypothetical protein